MMSLKLRKTLLPFCVRKTLMFMWMVTLLLTVLFLVLGIVSKVREIVHNGVEVNGASYEQCDIFFMLFNQPHTDLKSSEPSDVSLPIRFNGDVSNYSFDPRFLCNVESASRHHPNKTVCILLHLPPGSSTIRKLSTSLSKLDLNIEDEQLQYEDNEAEENEGYQPQSNIRVLSLNLDKIFEWSPLQDWWREELRYTLSIWKAVHLSQVARLGFLWKYGGLYLDHDVLVIKPLLEESTKAGRLDRNSNPKNLGPTYNFLGQNYIGFQSLNISHLMPNDPTPGENQDLYMEDTDSQGLGGDGIGTSVMRFKKPRHPFISKWMYSVPSNYDEDIRDSIGSTLATKLIIPFCQGDIPKSKINVTQLLNKFCDYNLHILETKAFYPVHWKQWECLFESTKTKGKSNLLDDDAMKNGIYAVHTWYDLYRRMRQVKDIPETSPYIKLAKTHCPSTYHTHMKSSR